MKVFGLQGEIMWSARLADKSCNEPEAIFRLKQLKRFERLRCAHGLTAAQAAEMLGVGRATLYRWPKHLEREGVRDPRPRPRRPRRVRRRHWDMRFAEAVRRLRMSFPAWSKAKPGGLARTQGHEVSDSAVGRILAWLKVRCRLPEANGPGGARRHGRPWRRPRARRAPYGLSGSGPGDLVQADVLHVRLLPGVTVYHFRAWDAASRWTVGAGLQPGEQPVCGGFSRTAPGP